MILSCLFAGLVLALAGCRSAPTSTAAPSLTAVSGIENSTVTPVVVIIQHTPTSEPEPLPTITPQTPADQLTEEPITPTTAGTDPSAASSPAATFTPASTPLPNPLSLAWPTPSVVPTSAWRPVGYPVPWAPTIYDHFYFARPIPADQVNTPLQDYRYGGDFLGDVIHTGVDFPAPEGTSVLAVGPGKVIWAGYGLYRGYKDETDPYGLAVAIQHDFGWQNQRLYTVYGHLSEVDVVIGQRVETGDLLGLSGETGRVTGPHLHFEVRIGENSFFATRNPELWLAPPQGWGVLAGRIMNSAGRLVEQQNMIVTSEDRKENWFSRTYGEGAVISDPYYRENIVVGDLPAGKYRIRIAYAGYNFETEVEIIPGMVNYFEFWGLDGYKFNSPPLPTAAVNQNP